MASNDGLLWAAALEGLDEKTVNMWCSRKRDAVEVLRDVEMLMNEAKEQAIRKRWKFLNPISGKAVVFCDVFSKITTWAKHFITIGDIVADCDPVHAALPWAGIRSILHVYSRHRQSYIDSRLVAGNRR